MCSRREDNLRATAGSVSTRELATARLELLRRRFTLFAMVMGTLIIAKTLMVAGLATWQKLDVHGAIVAVFAIKIGLGAVIIATPHVRQKRLFTLSRRQIVSRATFLVVLVVFSQVAGASLLGEVLTGLLHDIGIGWEVGALPPLLVILALVYISAALIVPWSVREALLPLIAMVGIVALGTLALTSSLTAKVLNSLLVLLAGAPALLISWLRYSRLLDRLALKQIAGRYRDIQYDLEVARRIHEGLFPAPPNEGAVLFSYSYQPASAIGGDYFEAIPGEDGSWTFVLLDVTGHGIAAALAVNRLHGEIKRTVAENEQSTPGEIISALNRYIRLTLADDHVFATGVALRIDPAADTMTYCGAGHPPVLLRRNGTYLERLDSTNPMLGILDSDTFVAREQAAPFQAGDVMLLYTDGATERSSMEDCILGVEGLEGMLSEISTAKATDIVTELRKRLDAYGNGNTDDDAILAAIWLETEA